MRANSSIGNADNLCHRVRDPFGDNEVVEGVIVARRRRRREEHSTNCIEPSRGTKGLGRNVPIAREDPRPFKGREACGGDSENAQVRFRQALVRAEVDRTSVDATSANSLYPCELEPMSIRSWHECEMG